MALKHGMANKHKLYLVWKGMRMRCRNPKDHHYKNYGGRGIIICPEWDSYMTFHSWAIDNGWTCELEIDRIDNNGNYCPANVRFVSCADNQRNRRDTKLSWEIAAAIRERRKAGVIYRLIAQEFNISIPHAQHVAVGNAWPIK